MRGNLYYGFRFQLIYLQLNHLFVGTVHEPAGDNYFVEDSVGNMDEISRQNIISDEDDAGNAIKVR